MRRALVGVDHPTPVGFRHWSHDQEIHHRIQFQSIDAEQRTKVPCSPSRSTVHHGILNLDPNPFSEDRTTGLSQRQARIKPQSYQKASHMPVKIPVEIGSDGLIQHIGDAAPRHGHVMLESVPA